MGTGRSLVTRTALAAGSALASVCIWTGAPLIAVWVGSSYDRISGRPHSARRTSPWLRSMRGEREEIARERQGMSVVERLVVISVIACALAFEVWFFLFAGSSLANS